MIPVYQTRFGESDGNCWAAVWASLLELPLELVDNIACASDDWEENTTKLLNEFGLYFLEYSWDSKKEMPFNLSLIPSGEYIIAGTTTPSGLKHAIIVQVEHHPVKIDDMTQMNFVVAHDPLGGFAIKGWEYELTSLILPIKSFK